MTPSRYCQPCRGKAARQHKHRVGCSGSFHSNATVSPGRIQTAACQPSRTHASPVPTATETELRFAVVKPFLGAGLPSELAQGRWKVQALGVCNKGDLCGWRVRGLLGTALLLGSRCCGVIAYMKAGEAPLLFLISSFFASPPPHRFPGFVQKHKRVIHHFSSSTRSALTSPSPLNPSPPEKGTRSAAKKARSGEGKAPRLPQTAPAQRATFSAGFSGCQPPKGEGQNSTTAETLSQKTDIGDGGKQFAPV